ncbi:sulfurtransferase [Microlunatus antarcticus]|uniref:Thiosulfate/3-mercaptopyruvate sulfurtransferase n=1 Tax=Microlunatus antarcticus TaxID=53388 RepID=A0A7W5JX30_9ACTN|nr:sulfurtransferase [Microlunatus antarcticus]MBB3327870.1 thiosulfate/3-mercaptopyruvate sulfurtransferase [Microlunatus antarcticus]
MTASTVLIGVDDLVRDRADGRPVRVLDVRWSLAEPDGRPAYRAGHIPGAVFVDLGSELSRHPAPGEGRHPLPDVADLQAAARSWGIDDGDAVVVYDDSGNLAASRAWWLLSHAGLDVSLLDGALGAWRAAGHELATGDETVEPGSVTLAYGTFDVLGLDDVEAWVAEQPLLDARAGERYRGEQEPIDPRAGHIPGALSAPTAENLDANGRFLGAAALRERFAGLGLDPDRPVGVYCGSGVTAAHEAVALTVAGYRPVLYPGSWSEWSSHPELPVATG